MTPSASFSTRERLFIVFSIVLGFMLLTANALSSGRRPVQEEASLPVVKNKTISLKFIGLERVETRFVTRMLNTSDKAITAYVMAVCDVPESATDYSIGSNSIAPGKIVEISTPVRALSDKCTSPATRPSITVQAIVLDDRSTEGDYEWAKGVLDDRRGLKIQLKRINRLLREAAEWADRDEPKAIERLKAEVSSLPVDEGEEPAVRGGLSAAKDRVLFYLTDLEQWHQSNVSSASVQHVSSRAEFAGITRIKEGIARLVTLSETWISKY